MVKSFFLYHINFDIHTYKSNNNNNNNNDNSARKKLSKFFGNLKLN